MNRIFRQWFKSYSNFSKGDRNTVIIIGILIFVVLVGNIIVSNISPKSKYDHLQYLQYLEELEAPKNDFHKSGKSLFKFNPNTIETELLDSLDLPDFIKRNFLGYRKSGGKFYTPRDFRKIYGMNDSIFSEIENFIIISENMESSVPMVKDEKRSIGFLNPNTADYATLMEFGFNRFQANNLIEYRKKAVFFKSKTDLLKIYGIDSAFFRSIEKQVLIEDGNYPLEINYSPELLHVELNRADSLDLIKLNGIGGKYAARIIKYRNLLGGFYSTSQLLEVYNFPAETFKEIEPSITVDTVLVKKIRINFAEFGDLLRHPYLNKEQVESILKYRDKNGSYQNLIQLKTSGLIDSETFSRISPYLTCR